MHHRIPPEILAHILSYATVSHQVWKKYKKMLEGCGIFEHYYLSLPVQYPIYTLRMLVELGNTPFTRIRNVRATYTEIQKMHIKEIYMPPTIEPELCHLYCSLHMTTQIDISEMTQLRELHMYVDDFVLTSIPPSVKKLVIWSSRQYNTLGEFDFSALPNNIEELELAVPTKGSAVHTKLRKLSIGTNITGSMLPPTLKTIHMWCSPRFMGDIDLSGSQLEHVYIDMSFTNIITKVVGLPRKTLTLLDVRCSGDQYENKIDLRPLKMLRTLKGEFRAYHYHADVFPRLTYIDLDIQDCTVFDCSKLTNVSHLTLRNGSGRVIREPFTHIKMSKMPGTKLTYLSCDGMCIDALPRDLSKVRYVSLMGSTITNIPRTIRWASLNKLSATCPKLIGSSIASQLRYLCLHGPNVYIKDYPKLRTLAYIAVHKDIITIPEKYKKWKSQLEYLYGGVPYYVHDIAKFE
jgi:hypothetical protein